VTSTTFSVAAIRPVERQTPADVPPTYRSAASCSPLVPRSVRLVIENAARRQQLAPFASTVLRPYGAGRALWKVMVIITTSGARSVWLRGGSCRSWRFVVPSAGVRALGAWQSFSLQAMSHVALQELQERAAVAGRVAGLVERTATIIGSWWRIRFSRDAAEVRGQVRNSRGTYALAQRSAGHLTERIAPRPA
jgi:hypothetical protein